MGGKAGSGGDAVKDRLNAQLKPIKRPRGHAELVQAQRQVMALAISGGNLSCLQRPQQPIHCRARQPCRAGNFRDGRGAMHRQHLDQREGVVDAADGARG